MADRKRTTFLRLTNGRLNRKQRRDLERQLSVEEPGLEIVNRNVVGIDVGNESHYVAVPPGRDPQPVQEFGSWTADLERMADWLKSMRHPNGRDAIYRRILCAEQRIDREGSSPSGAQMRSAVSKSGDNTSLAGESGRYGEA